MGDGEGESTSFLSGNNLIPGHGADLPVLS